MRLSARIEMWVILQVFLKINYNNFEILPFLIKMYLDGYFVCIYIYLFIYLYVFIFICFPVRKLPMPDARSLT